MYLFKTISNVSGGMSAVLFVVIIIFISTFLIYKLLNNTFLKKTLYQNIVMAVFFVITFIGLDLLIGRVFFPNGEYYNYGMQGVYIWVGLTLIPLIISVGLYVVFSYGKKDRQ